ncbi:hypothetical protein LXL04_001281 [Taraxacum kok-saghyz]
MVRRWFGSGPMCRWVQVVHRRWSGGGPMVVRWWRWSGGGLTVVRQWSGGGPTVVRCADGCKWCTDGGPAVVRRGSDGGPAVVRQWSGSGPAVVRQWSDVPMGASGAPTVVRRWSDGGPVVGAGGGPVGADMSSSDQPSPSLSEASEEELMRLSLDLVAAAKQTIGFLRDVAESHWLHHTPVLVESVRRYHQLWMPMMADLTTEAGKPPMVFPSLDIEWVWFCHTLNPVSYREYCESRFSKLIGKPAIFNQENKDYALERCREIWIAKYPSEPFENETDSSDFHAGSKILHTDHLLGETSKQRCLFTMFSNPYMLELVYLISAKKRYKSFIFMLQKFADSSSSFVPTSDILLMWITHKSYPTAYTIDEKEMEKVVGSGEPVTEEDLEMTKKLWEKLFDQPYEKAGCTAIGGVNPPPLHWEVTDSDVNVKYRPLLPRFLLEVNILVKLIPMTKTVQTDVSKEFLRFQFLRCHRDLKLNNPISTISSNSWQKVVNLYCEFGTKGVVVELRRKGGVCINGSKLLESKTFMWNDLLRAPSITLDGVVGQKARVVVSITPPAQAPYLLKSVPDRVTDDSGAMVSEVILKMNQYRPQEGRWLSRTVLDHAGRECFVVRNRVGGGFWRRGGNKPTVVKWEDRCIEIREGSWLYVAGSIGRAPEKVIGTATPKTPSQGWQAQWIFSTGHELFIRLESSTAMTFLLNTTTSTASQARLLNGRHMQYQDEKNEGSEEGFVTLVRFTEENPNGRATGLLNWKLSVVEFLPEEDTTLMLLLKTAILRSITEIKKEDVGSLLIRRRLKEARHGARDWGSIIMLDSLVNSVYVKPWYWNAKDVMAREGVDYVTKSYSAEECGDELYKHALFGFGGNDGFGKNGRMVPPKLVTSFQIAGRMKQEIQLVVPNTLIQIKATTSSYQLPATCKVKPRIFYLANTFQRTDSDQRVLSVKGSALEDLGFSRSISSAI